METEKQKKEKASVTKNASSSGKSLANVASSDAILSRMSAFPRSRHKMKRLGRGRSSGHGGTSTKGHKGQRARSGFGLLRGFEGGQMPLVRLLPKFGFTNSRFKTRYDIVNLSQISRFDSEVTPEVLSSAGLVGKNSLVKILAKGVVEKPLKVRAHRFSKKAVELIKKAGGGAEVIVVSASPPAEGADLQKEKKPEDSVSVRSKSSAGKDTTANIEERQKPAQRSEVDLQQKEDSAIGQEEQSKQQEQQEEDK